MKDDKLYLNHILESINRIEQYTAKGKNEFFDDTKTQDAVLRNLQILAESTQRLSSDLKSKYPNIDWANISAFRNIVAHDYLAIDTAVIWYIIKDDIPPLKQTVEFMLNEIK